MAKKGQEIARKVVDATVSTVIRAVEAPRRARDKYESDMYTYGERMPRDRPNDR